MKIIFPFLMLLFLLGSCNSPSEVPSKIKAPLYTARAIDFSAPVQTIAFGSCNREDLPQTIWEEILANDPDLWIWLGDNIYADTEDMGKMEAKYIKQKYAPGYQQLLKSTRVIGTWDDHDYGLNDGDKHFVKKKESQQLLLDFLDVAHDAPARSREGVYQAYAFGEGERRVKVILLDTRYFRDKLEKNFGMGPRYKENADGDILGEAQWKWLEEELLEGDAKVHLICSGIQILPEEQYFEKWANFPKARKRLLELISRTNPSLPILLSGDRHIAEVSVAGLPEKDSTITEITSSGLTHSYEKADEPNAYRVGKLIPYKNYGLLTIDWKANPVKFKLSIKGPNQQTHLRYSF